MSTPTSSAYPAPSQSATTPPPTTQDPITQIYQAHEDIKYVPPASSAPTPQMSSYSSVASQSAARGALYTLGQSSYPAPPAYSSSPATTNAQPIAPAPAVGRNAPVLRPMPTQNVIHQPAMSYASALLPHQLPEAEPTHVVGSQGRRGILPSAPGRPSVSQVSAKGGAMVPQKDADGKFPCPHCTKTYLHAKHLKRHLLRHTGDRPYMCVLCRDTFSRSDILKRHFQKCSIRRGNPTGVSHLSHPQAHVKKVPKQQMPDNNEIAQLNGLSQIQNDNGIVNHFNIVSDLGNASTTFSSFSPNSSSLSGANASSWLP